MLPYPILPGFPDGLNDYVRRGVVFRLLDRDCWPRACLLKRLDDVSMCRAD